MASETGESEATVAKWLERASVPGGAAFLRLVAAYGPEFLCAAMERPPPWLDAASRERRRAALARDLAEVEEEIRAAAE